MPVDLDVPDSQRDPEGTLSSYEAIILTKYRASILYPVVFALCFEKWDAQLIHRLITQFIRTFAGYNLIFIGVLPVYLVSI